MNNEAPDTLRREVSEILLSSSKEKPTDWSSLMARFVENTEGPRYSRDELIAAVNSLLRPRGSAFGADNKFWTQPEGSRT